MQLARASMLVEAGASRCKPVQADGCRRMLMEDANNCIVDYAAVCLKPAAILYGVKRYGPSDLSMPY